MITKIIKSFISLKNSKYNFKFIELYNNFFPIVYSEIFGYVKNEKAAKILSEEIFVKLFNTPEITYDKNLLNEWFNKSITNAINHECLFS